MANLYTHCIMNTYSDNKNIYSVDMMIAYVNLFKPKYVKINVDDLIHNIECECWGDPTNNIRYSPQDVLKNPKKYKNEVERINNANLRYPIMVHGKNIIDGVHRLTKSAILNKKTMRVYIFDSALMKKFIIDKKKDWQKVDKIKTREIIELFYKNFKNDL